VILDAFAAFAPLGAAVGTGAILDVLINSALHEYILRQDNPASIFTITMRLSAVFREGVGYAQGRDVLRIPA